MSKNNTFPTSYYITIPWLHRDTITYRCSIRSRRLTWIESYIHVQKLDGDESSTLIKKTLERCITEGDFSIVQGFPHSKLDFAFEPAGLDGEPPTLEQLSQLFLRLSVGMRPDLLSKEVDLLVVPEKKASAKSQHAYRSWRIREKTRIILDAGAG